ncbi:AP-5 complex subunit beta-1-like [Elysia marginata]|uniref:AP-5 complex subunit beta-1-like n=1 Tax=Elysia marginata TaxID=1093978 RepID=A0AAV4I8P4_9GAST|nr:AP-5 complex subunit beta-1-like [Elysia marginata]
MASSGSSAKQRRTAEHWLRVVEKVRGSLSSGNVHKLFEDDYFIFELIKLLYQDSVEASVKIEILSVIEQYGSGVLPTNSVDQSVSALLDVFRNIYSGQGQTSVAAQLLITITTIFIENEELLETSLCSMFTSQLVDLINKVNHIASRRLRSCACQCLVQLETMKPGLLWKWHEVFIKLVKEERTDVGQDYMYLLIAVTSYVNQVENTGQQNVQTEQGNPEGKELLPVVSYIMDNVFYLSPPGLSAIACHIVAILKRCPGIPATDYMLTGRKQDLNPGPLCLKAKCLQDQNTICNVFKPLVLQCLSSLDPCIISLMLFIEGEFHREIISEAEERILVQRSLQFLKNANINTNTRLFIAHWLIGYINKSYPPASATSLKKAILPNVFDPIDVHTCKLDFAVKCCGQGSDNDLTTELHYLTQLAETTGSVRITCALYHVLFSHVTQNSSEAIGNLVLSITKTLFQNFPHLIPVIVDFLQAVKTSGSHGKLHSEILTLLHETVLSLPIKSLLTNYHNYLQVWLLSAQDTSMLQQRPVRRLLDLVKEAAANVKDDWHLGCMVLSICRAMMLHHHTDILYWRKHVSFKMIR